MSRFAAAIDLVIRELDGRKAAGYDDWRASAESLVRLRSAPALRPSTLTIVAKASEPARAAVAADLGAPKKERLQALRASSLLPCPRCPYGGGQHGHVVFGVGSVDAELMFVGEAPGAEEDARGEPFVGKAGQLLTKIIATMGYQREDVYIANILKCRPDLPDGASGNRPPTVEEMESCRPCLAAQIDIIKPRAIVALGATAMRGLLDSSAPMRDVRGQWQEYRSIPVMVTYHPAYLLRNQSLAEKRKVWEDMLQVKERLGHPITERDRGYFLTKP